MPNTMGNVLQKLKAKKRLSIQLTVGLIFLALVGLYTFSHNANLSLAGTNPRFHPIGIVAAAAGELFMLYAFVTSLFSAGSQRVAAVLSDAAMLFVLLGNTVIDYANESRQIPISAQWLFEMYSTFGVPIVIILVLVVGLHFILHTDHAVQMHSAEIAAEVAEQQIETVAIFTARDEMVEQMNNSVHTDKVRHAAQATVTSIIDRIAAKKRA